MAVDLVDPHGLHLADALPKLQGLALYAEKHVKAYRRIESVAEAKGKLRVLDLTSPMYGKVLPQQQVRKVSLLGSWQGTIEGATARWR